MIRPEFENLPFDERPDLSPYIIHLTKNTKEMNECSTFDNLVNILETGEIWGSSAEKGFIKGHNKATCFMDIPFMSLKYLFIVPKLQLGNDEQCLPPNLNRIRQF